MYTYYIKGTLWTSFMYFIIQAKKFLKGDWLNEWYFQPNLKYLHYFISIATDTVLFWLWKHGGKVSLISVNAIYLNYSMLQCPSFAMKSLPYPSGFDCIFIVQLKKIDKETSKDSTTTTFMNETGSFASELTRTCTVYG